MPVLFYMYVCWGGGLERERERKREMYALEHSGGPGNPTQVFRFCAQTHPLQLLGNLNRLLSWVNLEAATSRLSWNRSVQIHCL